MAGVAVAVAMAGHLLVVVEVVVQSSEAVAEEAPTLEVVAAAVLLKAEVVEVVPSQAGVAAAGHTKAVAGRNFVER